MKVLDLFAGIGGFSLGLERVLDDNGKPFFESVAFCEIEPFCQKVLAKHWPGIPIYSDVRELTYERLKSDGIIRGEADEGTRSTVEDTISTRLEKYGSLNSSVSRRSGQAVSSEKREEEENNGLIITAGFPCQDISVAGKQTGIDGERSGLWSECARLLREIRPHYAIFENVTALLSGERGKWFERVLWDISEVGYDAEWHCIPASAVGAHHRRDRVWILAYPRCKPDESERISGVSSCPTSSYQSDRDKRERIWPETTNSGEDVSNTLQPGLQGSENTGTVESSRKERDQLITRCDTFYRGWDTEPDVGRVANGIPNRTHRLKALGNSVCPQIPEIIGRAILESQSDLSTR